MNTNIVGLPLIALGGYAIIVDATNGNVAWVLVDIFAFPLAILRGLFLLLT